MSGKTVSKTARRPLSKPFDTQGIEEVNFTALNYGDILLSKSILLDNKKVYKLDREKCHAVFTRPVKSNS